MKENKMLKINEWNLCRDKETKFYYYVKEIKENGRFELFFSFYPNYENGWIHGGIKFVAKTLEEFIDSIYYNKYKSETLDIKRE
jgi:hypothetical protein